MWGLFVGAAAAALAPAGPGALVPLKMAIASADSVGNDVYVAVVVDFGSGSSMSSVSKCVPVASSAHDSDALAAAVGSDNVVYNTSGLLCAIDGYPSTNPTSCGQSAGNGDYDYWSYWHGSTGSWVYANDGPAEQSVSSPADDVEGWMYQNGEPDTPSSPPPKAAPSYAQICNASTEVPPAQSPSAPAPAPTPTTTAPTSSETPTTGRTSTSSAPAATPTAPVSTRPQSSPGATTTTTSAPHGTTTTLTPGAKSGTGGGSRGSSGTHRTAVASAIAHDEAGGGSSSNLVPVILIAVVVAALGAFALFRWRRRPAEE
jgi:hypothetical protein